MWEESENGPAKEDWHWDLNPDVAAMTRRTTQFRKPESKT